MLLLSVAVVVGVVVAAVLEPVLKIKWTSLIAEVRTYAETGHSLMPSMKGTSQQGLIVMGERSNIKWTTIMMLALKKDTLEKFRYHFRSALGLC